jgi:cytochrome c
MLLMAAGRFIPGLGHTNESYSEPLFLRHLLAGIQYAIGEGKALDYSKAYAVKAPEDNRFTKTVLSNDLNEPMELTVAPDGRVFFTERSGKFYVYDPAKKKTRLLHDFPAKAVDKYLNGLIGVTLDPDFKTNRQLYVFYSSNTGTQYHQNVSRFQLTPEGNLDTTSEKIIIKIPIDLEVSAHTGGSLAWDKHNNLYISTGDNTVPFESDGYAPSTNGPDGWCTMRSALRQTRPICAEKSCAFTRSPTVPTRYRKAIFFKSPCPAHGRKFM